MGAVAGLGPWRARRRAASRWGARRRRWRGRRRCAGPASPSSTGGTGGSSSCATSGGRRRPAAPSCSASCPSPWSGPTTSSWAAGECGAGRAPSCVREGRLTAFLLLLLSLRPLSPLQVPAAGDGEGAGNGRRHPSERRARPHHERRTGCQGEEKRHIK